MKRVVLATVCLSIALATLGCNTSLPPFDGWKSYESKDGSLSVKFPEKPKRIDQQQSTPHGQMKFRIMSYETRNGVLQATSMKYPVDPSQYDVDAGLRGAVDGAAKNTDSEIAEEKDIKRFGLPGKQILLKMKKHKGFCSAIAFMDPAGPTLYLVQAVGTESFVNSDGAKSFLKSCEIKPISKKKSKNKKKG